MRTLLITLLLAALPLAAATRAAADAPAPSVRRFALIVGANDGGAGRVRLRYATTDATAVARVFEDLGGISRSDRLLLLEPDRAGLFEALGRLRAALARGRSPGTRLEVVFYYSGHSDELGLLLRGERITYDDLRQAINAVPADVRVAILDSCSSGAMTRRKGGVRRPPFLFDGSSRVAGHAYLTSASMDEAAQESDRIRGSFFTHFLVSGLRGAADLSRDRRVTLNEVYQFAFNETLARTERTQGGAQHPSYDIQLAGSGDLVLTDLHGTAATMVLDADVAGRLSVRDRAGNLVAELTKPAGRVIELGLDPGEYRITLDQPPHVREGRVRLERGGRAHFATGLLVAQAAERVATRGDGTAELAAEVAAAPAPARRYRIVPFNLSLVPELSVNGHGPGALNFVALNLVYGESAALRGVAVGVAGSIVREDVAGVQVSAGLNYAGGWLRGAQVGAGANLARGPARGGQVTAGFNLAGPGSRVVQAAAGFNLVGAGAQGGQVAAGFNWAEGAFEGVQVAAGLNRAAGRSRGLQVTAGLNLADELVGAQVAAGINSAGVLRGAQVGVVNFGGEVQGTQIGVVNIARRARLQIGVVNVAEDAEAVGLVNAIKHGAQHVDAWGSETIPAAIAVRLGGRRFYGLLAAGLNPGTDRVRSAYGGGLGVHTPLGAGYFADVDLLEMSLHDGENVTQVGQLTSLRLAVGCRLARRLAVYGGPSFNVFVSQDRQSPAIGFGPQQVYQMTAHTIRLWPGFFAGIQI
ncbi:MAG TPA: caspase family protein [Polyangia bacterium]|jgi:hypothetical protein